MDKRLQRNIWLLNLLRLLRSALFVMPVIVLFFESRWLTMTEVFLLQSIFAWAVVLLEVPTWYLGDILTRKQWLIIWAVCKLLGWILYRYAPWFWLLAWAEIVLAIWFTFVSGTDIAMLYDSLLASGKEDVSKKIQWYNSAAGNIGEWIAAFIGGRIAAYSLDRPIALQIILSLLALILTLFLVEPPREKYQITETWPRQLLWLVRYALFTHSKISALIIASATIWLSTMFWVWIAQPYRSQVNIPLARFGMLRGIGNLSVGVFSLLAHRLETYISKENILIYLLPVSIFGYLLLWSVMARRIIPCMFFFYAVRGIKSVVLQDMLNKLISSKERATILSVDSLTFRALFMIFWPLAGLAIDNFGIANGLLSIASLLTVLRLTSLFFLRKSGLTGISHDLTR
jgi:predicted MFS family arabinose efflux permease